MREPDRDKARLEHILTAINCVEEYTKGISEQQLKDDRWHLRDDEQFDLLASLW